LSHRKKNRGIGERRNPRIENRDIPERVSEVEVFFYPEEWEVLDQQPIKNDNTCIVQNMQEGDIS
jgi:hypothetical protein